MSEGEAKAGGILCVALLIGYGLNIHTFEIYALSAILALGDTGIRERLAAYRAAQTQSVLDGPDPAA